MNVSFKRKFHESYMVIEAEEEIPESHELFMLKYNQVEGLLSLETEISDGRLRFWYEITGMQSIADLLERKGADEELLRRIFCGIDSVCRMLTEFMLEENALVLEPDYLFFHTGAMQLGILYLPGRRADIRESFQSLMESILKKVRHDDRRGTKLAYEMYEQSLQRERSFSEMWRETWASSSEECCKENDTWEYGNTDTHQRGQSQTPPPDGERYREKELEKKKPEEYFMKPDTREEGSTGIWRVFTGIKKVFERDTAQNGETNDYDGEISRQDLSSDENDFRTEFLAGEHNVQGILRYQGQETQPDLIIDRDCYVLGKEEESVDGCVRARGVSRVHARITKEDGAYYIEDMNSTNGTYLNEQAVLYRQKEKLSSGDCICLAREKFIFL